MARGRLDPPDLDDRKWQDLVDQARDLIPIYSPEWTDHNPSDLGMTLVELFAWLVEGMIYRLNQVPDKNFIEFLNLVGITRDPATPASTWLTFLPKSWVSALWKICCGITLINMWTGAGFIICMRLIPICLLFR